jgi:hypothetical protein
MSKLPFSISLGFSAKPKPPVRQPQSGNDIVKAIRGV